MWCFSLTVTFKASLTSVDFGLALNTSSSFPHFSFAIKLFFRWDSCGVTMQDTSCASLQKNKIQTIGFLANFYILKFKIRFPYVTLYWKIISLRSVQTWQYKQNPEKIQRHSLQVQTSCPFQTGSLKFRIRSSILSLW